MITSQFRNDLEISPSKIYKILSWNLVCSEFMKLKYALLWSSNTCIGSVLETALLELIKSNLRMS